MINTQHLGRVGVDLYFGFTAAGAKLDFVGDPAVIVVKADFLHSAACMALGRCRSFGCADQPIMIILMVVIIVVPVLLDAQCFAGIGIDFDFGLDTAFFDIDLIISFVAAALKLDALNTTV